MKKVNIYKINNILSVLVLGSLLNSCKIYSTHPRNWETTELFWFIIVSLAILWFGVRIYDIFFPRNKKK